MSLPSEVDERDRLAECLLERLGLEVHYGEQISCDPAGRPVATEPNTGASVRRGDAVTVLLSYQAANTDCVADLREPWRCLDFATGYGPVTLVVEIPHTVRKCAAWSLCSGSAPSDCGVSPLVVAGRDVEVETGEFSDVTRFPDGQTCELIDLGGLPDGLPVEKQIVMYPAELESCDDDWAVWLWIDDEGRVTTVNLLVPAH